MNLNEGPLVRAITTPLKANHKNGLLESVWTWWKGHIVQEPSLNSDLSTAATHLARTIQNLVTETQLPELNAPNQGTHRTLRNEKARARQLEKGKEDEPKQKRQGNDNILRINQRYPLLPSNHHTMHQPMMPRHIIHALLVLATEKRTVHMEAVLIIRHYRLGVLRRHMSAEALLSSETHRSAVFPCAVVAYLGARVYTLVLSVKAGGVVSMRWAAVKECRNALEAGRFVEHLVAALFWTKVGNGRHVG